MMCEGSLIAGESWPQLWPKTILNIDCDKRAIKRDTRGGCSYDKIMYMYIPTPPDPLATIPVFAQYSLNVLD
jgi:hypothetical protein